jgi:toxin-antitoxin system PIN domain toxin
MVLPDVNVLVYAFRSDSPFYPVSRAWLDGVVQRDAPFGLSPLALSAVVRIVTNPRTFAIPTSAADAFAYCDNLLAQPFATRIEPGERHWAIFRKLCLDTATRGGRVSDVWYAALAIEHGCTFVTFDRDFARFPGLTSFRPTA